MNEAIKHFERYQEDDIWTHKIFEFDEFKGIQDDDAKDFIRRLLTENYDKPWDAAEFQEDNEDAYGYKASTASADYSDIRLSTMQALTHPWIQGVAEKLIAELTADGEGENNSMDIAKLSLQGLEHFRKYDEKLESAS